MKMTNANGTNVPMTAEMQQLANDPNFVVEFVVGDPAPDLVPQSRDDGIRMSGVYFDETKRYVMKSCHLSKNDVRILDVATGRVVMVSHHPGKNPYENLDPLGIGKTQDQHAVHGGSGSRPATSRQDTPPCRASGSGLSPSCGTGGNTLKKKHGRGDEAIIMNIGKKSKLSTQSIRPHFEVGKGPDGDDDYTIVGDMMARTFSITNNRGELVAQVAKTTKAMIQKAILGSGSECTIDVAPGVDCSTVLAIVYGLGQVGHHYVKDMANNYVVDPIKDSLVGGAVDAVPGMGGMVDAYSGASNSIIRKSQKLKKIKIFYDDKLK